MTRNHYASQGETRQAALPSTIQTSLGDRPDSDGPNLTQEGTLQREDESAATKLLPALPMPLSESPSPPAVPTDPIAAAEASNRAQQSLEMLWTVQSPTTEQRQLSAEAAAYRLIGIEPRDVIEQMLAAQMIALHSATIDCVRRASLPGQDGDIRREELALASKASRAFAALADTFAKRRRGGNQKVTVEHVHVHAGGQAIVGNVAGGGRGRRRKCEG